MNEIMKDGMTGPPAETTTEKAAATPDEKPAGTPDGKPRDKDGRPLEIERKFLIAMPDTDWLEHFPGCERIRIRQTYFATETEKKLRLRIWETDGKTVYILTKKTRLTDMTRIEEEAEISKEEYERLLSGAREIRELEKIRYRLPYDGKLVEVDIFPFWKERALAEVELRSETEAVSLPPELSVVREVTGEAKYSNYRLAEPGGKDPAGGLQRIDKLLSGLGLLSRSDCRKAVRKGEILINGRAVRSPEEKADPERDEICYLGKRLDTRMLVYYMLHKPAGVITSREKASCGNVFELIDDRRRDLAAVGRLDKDTTGLLLLTNDGALNHRLLSPRSHVEKVYEALIDGTLTKEDAGRLTEGIDIGDDKPTLPAKLRELDRGNPQRVELTITEGRYHQVKRMFEAVGKPVLRLHRSAFGTLRLDGALAPGEARELTEEELEKLL